MSSNRSIAEIASLIDGQVCTELDGFIIEVDNAIVETQASMARTGPPYFASDDEKDQIKKDLIYGKRRLERAMSAFQHYCNIIDEC